MPPLKAQLLLEESLSAYFPEMVFTDSGITVQLHRNTQRDTIFGICMRLTSPWTPRLVDTRASASERLVAALTEDILEGVLDSGDRLPAHRDLADKLSIGVAATEM